jgi:hypothetical protein
MLDRDPDMAVVVLLLALAVTVPGSARAQTPTAATLIQPPAGAVAVDQSAPITWSRVANARAYYLYIGSTPGAKDLLDSGELHVTSFSLPDHAEPLPAGKTIYLTLWTDVGGTWAHDDSTFTAAPTAPVFIYPVDGAVGVSTSQPFRWTPPPHARKHTLRIGTSPGGRDVYDNDVPSPTTLVSGLPRRGTLYARAMAQVGDQWQYTDIAFSVDTLVAGSRLVRPADGDRNVDTTRPFEWAEVPLARGYRLTIGRAPGASDLDDSGVIQVTRRFLPALPLGTVYGRLYTQINGAWQTNDFTVEVSARGVSTALQIESAAWAARAVRAMAFDDNRPFSWTPLRTRGMSVNCTDYVDAFLQLWREMNGQLEARRLDVAFNPNSYDAHTLVELRDPESSRWLLIDPTFDLSVIRPDGARATAEEISSATRLGRWSDVRYVLGTQGDFYVRRYPIDYPLLFVNVYHEGRVPVNAMGEPLLPYLQDVVMPISTTQRQRYVVRCAGDKLATIKIDGAVQTIDCSGVDGLSHVFDAWTIEPTGQTSRSVRVYQPRRFVF